MVCLSSDNIPGTAMPTPKILDLYVSYLLVKLVTNVPISLKYSFSFLKDLDIRAFFNYISI